MNIALGSVHKWRSTSNGVPVKGLLQFSGIHHQFVSTLLHVLLLCALFITT